MPWVSHTFCSCMWNLNQKTILIHGNILNVEKLGIESLFQIWNVYCVSHRFYIGCDLCSNWFHGACVGITEKEAQKLEAFVCNDCKRGQEGSSAEELYCICRTPYDESQYGYLLTIWLMLTTFRIELWNHQCIKKKGYVADKCLNQPYISCSA